MRVVWVRRLAFYMVVVAVLLIVHTDFVARLAGDSIGDLARRNSEAYLLTALVAGYWDLAAWRCTPDPGVATPCAAAPLARQAVYLGSMILGVIVTQSELAGLDLSNAIVTLGEAFAAAFVIALYLGSSRGFLGRHRRPVDGTAVAAVWWRVGYYTVVLLVTLVIYQAWLRGLVGAGVVDRLQVNAEAYAAMLLVPVYFDVVVGRPPRRRLLWYVGLLAVPLLVQAAGAAGPLLGWLERTTEAFIAAAVVSVYFDVIRGVAAVSDPEHPTPA